MRSCGEMTLMMRSLHLLLCQSAFQICLHPHMPPSECKDAVNRGSIIQSLQVRRNSSFLSAVRTIEPSRPKAYLSTDPSFRTTCHPARTLDRPASSIRTKCLFRPDPILYREVSVPACIRPDVSAACPDASQHSTSF
jgi:hypothetical protein